MTGDLQTAFEPIRAALRRAAWPCVVESTSYGTPSLKVGAKFLCRLKDAETLVIRMELDEKELRMELEPALFFETDHYKGWPAVLARLGALDAARLDQLIEQAWRMQAPSKVVAAFDRKDPPHPNPLPPEGRGGS